MMLKLRKHEEVQLLSKFNTMHINDHLVMNWNNLISRYGSIVYIMPFLCFKTRTYLGTVTPMDIYVSTCK